MELITFGEGRKALLFGDQKINLHQKENSISPVALFPTSGAIDLCFITDTPIEEVEKKLIDLNVNIVEGIVSRTGAKGRILSLYIFDPDGNLIEISNYANQ
jgi:catechol 2,3-dioxygenase-like lactoylglutathione lyase family enzyme